MLEPVAAALNRRDYPTAARLIAALVAQRPDDHQVQLYAAQLQEVTTKLDNALEIYRLLLPTQRSFVRTIDLSYRHSILTGRKSPSS